MNDDDELWTINQVRRTTGLGRTTIYVMERNGRFPKKRHITNGRRVAFFKSEVLAWMNALPTEPVTP